MEIIAVFMGIGFVAYLVQRREQKDQFPDQICGYCPIPIFFDWKELVWKHEYGVQYMDEPYRHPAMPPYNSNAYLS